MIYFGISRYSNVGITTNIPDLWNIMVSNAHIAVSIYFCFCMASIIKINNATDRHCLIAAYIKALSMIISIINAKVFFVSSCWNKEYIATKYMVEITAVITQKEHPSDFRKLQKREYPNSNLISDGWVMMYDIEGIFS